MNKAVFLDKDGTIVENIPYNVNPLLIKPATGVIESLPRLKKAGYKLIVISNQSGISRGYFSREQLLKSFEALQALLIPYQSDLDAFYFCPHYETSCTCRKPLSGLLLQATKDFNIDLKNSWAIGDILNDIEAGKRIGCQTILIRNGNETEWILSSLRLPSFIVSNFSDASGKILSGN